jgi:hypothetical protein
MTRTTRHRGLRSFAVGRALLLALLLALAPQLAAADGYRFTGVERVVAVGDPHGAYEELVATLRGTGVVDEELRWSGGKTHLVSLGDLLDRGDYGRQVMDLLIRLQGEAAAAGGAVHVVLGNHEVMNLSGDLRYVSEGDYAQFGETSRDGLPPGFLERRAAFAPDGEYGRWLLGQPGAIVINDTLFLHAGVSPLLDGLTLESLNASVRRDVQRFAAGWHVLLEAGVVSDSDGLRAIIARASNVPDDADARVREAGAAVVAAAEGLPFYPDGPQWYRGNIFCHPYTETAMVERILTQLGATRLVVGHTVTANRRVNQRLDGRLIAADTGMNTAYYRGGPAALVLEGGETWAWYPGQDRQPLDQAPTRTWDRPFGLDDARIEAFLRTAEVVSIEAPQGRRPAPRRVTLEQDGQRLEAVFNTRDTAPGLQAGRWARSADRADRYSHEIAAYLVDRMLGLEMVPVTVERTIGEETGSLRVWIDSSFSEAQRRAEQIAFDGHCDLAPQYDLMNVFGVLIFNPEQDLGSLRYDRRWQLWLVDQSRAFGVATDVPGMLRRSSLTLTPQMTEALAAITPERAAELAPYLHPRQVEALVRRAEQLRALR